MLQEVEEKKKETGKGVDVVPKQPRLVTGGSYTTVQSPLADAYLWTLKRREELEKLFPFVHPQLQPDTSRWQLIDSNLLPSVFNLHRESPGFVIENEFLNLLRTGKRNSKNIVTNKVNGEAVGGDEFRRRLQNETVKYEKLKLFQCNDTDSHHSSTFYVGGPVWSMAWCPMTTNVCDDEQFLALCSHWGEHSFEPQTICHEPVVLQLWNCGKLPVRPIGNFKLVRFFQVATCVVATWQSKYCFINKTTACLLLLLLVTRPLPMDGGMAEDHAAPEAGQLPKVWTRGRKETESHQRVSSTKSL